jgi:hypothetical protein
MSTAHTFSPNLQLRNRKVSSLLSRRFQQRFVGPYHPANHVPQQKFCSFSGSSSNFPPRLPSSRNPVALFRLQRAARIRSLSGCRSPHPRDLAVAAGNYRRRSVRFCDNGEIYPYEPQPKLVTQKYHRRNRKRENGCDRPQL